MTTPIREYCQVTVESAYGTPKTTPTRGTDQIVIRLDEGNAFTMEPTPITVGINYGGGFAVKCDTVSGKMEVKGQLKTKLTYAQAQILLGLGMDRVATGVPWTTSEPVNDLASVTIDHAIWQDDTAAFKYYRYTGVKCASGKLDVSEQSQVMTLSLDLQGGICWPNPYDSSYTPSVTDNVIPVDSDYPTDYVLFEHSDGGLTLASARALYWSLGIGWQNKLDVNYFAKHWVQRIRSYGRDVSLDTEQIGRAHV